MSLGWDWAARCRALGGNPTRELFEEAVAAGPLAVPLMVDILSRRAWREGRPDDCALLPVHAMRVLAEIEEPGAIPALVGVLCDPVDPAVHGEEAALALARLGEAMIPPVARVLRDRSLDTWVRAGAGRALVFAAAIDTALRPRVLEELAHVLGDPSETDRLFVAQVVHDACLLGAIEIVPSIEAAFLGDRVDPEFIDPYGADTHLHRTEKELDPEVVELISRDVRSEYLSWSDLEAGLPAEDLAMIAALVEAASREQSPPPEEELLDDDAEPPGADD